MEERGKIGQVRARPWWRERASDALKRQESRASSFLRHRRHLLRTGPTAMDETKDRDTATASAGGPLEGQASGSNSAATEGPPRKQVQVVGAPPVYHGAGRKEEPLRDAGSEDDDDDDDEGEGEDNDAGQDEKVEEAGSDREIPDEDLLAEFDDDENVSEAASLTLQPALTACCYSARRAYTSPTSA